MKALVVDDSRAARSIVRRILDELGCDVTEAGDGRDAIERLRAAGTPDVVLVDWNMPEMNGVEFIRQVRANPDWRGLRVVMVTTEVERPHIALAMAAGADEYVMKPFTRDILLGKLQAIGVAGVPSA